jgi:hypothetical protein
MLDTDISGGHKQMWEWRRKVALKDLLKTASEIIGGTWWHAMDVNVENHVKVDEVSTW